MHAVGRLLATFPPDCGLPLAVALHRSVDSTSRVLVDYLQRRSALPVEEAEDKAAIEPGHVYVAPPDYHLLVEPGSFALSVDAPVRQSRPSIDVLFESAADAYGDEVIAIVLTGANSDGAAGIRRVKEEGGATFAQDLSTAERTEMPGAAIATGAVDQVLTIEHIGAAVVALANGVERS
jgi:two-component system chemotaxis response regulator CheB